MDDFGLEVEALEVEDDDEPDEDWVDDELDDEPDDDEDSLFAAGTVEEEPERLSVR